MPETIDPIALAAIAQQLAPGATVLRAWPLRGGISAQMTAVELALPNAATRRGELRRVIVRQPGDWALREYPQAARREFRVLEIAREVGAAAPAPLLLDESGALLPHPYLVIEFTEGEVEAAPADPNAFADGLAAELARLHRIDGTRPELADLRGQAAWLADARQARPEEVDESLGARRIRALLAAVAAVDRPLPHPNPPALLHGDAWPGNLIWRAGRLVSMIDWEEAHVGDPLEDLAIARFDTLSMLGAGGMARLTHTYAALQPHVDLTDLPYWDLYAALRPVNNMPEWAGGWAALGRTDITAAALREAHRWFVGEAWARVGA